MGCRKAQDTARHHLTQRQEGVLCHVEPERCKTDCIGRYASYVNVTIRSGSEDKSEGIHLDES